MSGPIRLKWRSMVRWNRSGPAGRELSGVGSTGAERPGPTGAAQHGPVDAEQCRRAERALHRRATLACAAATRAGVPGQFRAWEHAGLYAVSATHPDLAFLTTISGVTAANATDAIDLSGAADRSGVPPAILSCDSDSASQLRAAGLTREADRVMAVHPLGPTLDLSAGVTDDSVGEAFLQVLLGGYQVDGVVAAYIRAEHGLAEMRRFLLYGRDEDVATGVYAADREPIAAAAMTIHGDVAVLGGAATLPACRGKGAQSRLLRHRLRVAADAGCALAVATAAPDSVSAANLERAGFRIHRRTAWRRGSVSVGRADSPRPRRH